MFVVNWNDKTKKFVRSSKKIQHPMAMKTGIYYLHDFFCLLFTESTEPAYSVGILYADFLNLQDVSKNALLDFLAPNTLKKTA